VIPFRRIWVFPLPSGPDRLSADEPVALNIQDVRQGRADKDDGKGEEECHDHSRSDDKPISIWGSKAATAAQASAMETFFSNPAGLSDF